MGVLPVRGPGYRNLGGSRRNVVEELTSIVVFAKIRDTGGAIDRGKDGAIEGSGEVLSDGAPKGSTGVDADKEEEHGC